MSAGLWLKPEAQREVVEEVRGHLQAISEECGAFADVAAIERGFAPASELAERINRTVPAERLREHGLSDLHLSWLQPWFFVAWNPPFIHLAVPAAFAFLVAAVTAMFIGRDIANQVPLQVLLRSCTAREILLSWVHTCILALVISVGVGISLDEDLGAIMPIVATAVWWGCGVLAFAPPFWRRRKPGWTLVQGLSLATVVGLWIGYRHSLAFDPWLHRVLGFVLMASTGTAVLAALTLAGLRHRTSSATWKAIVAVSAIVALATAFTFTNRGTAIDPLACAVAALVAALSVAGALSFIRAPRSQRVRTT